MRTRIKLDKKYYTKFSTGHQFKLIHNVQYTYSRKYIKSEHNLGRDTFNKIIKKITKKAREYMISEQDGVYLEGFGYFFIFMTPRAIRFSHYKSLFGRGFYPSFVCVEENSPLRFYSIPYYNTIKKEVNKNVFSRRLYTFNLSLLPKTKKYIYIA